MMIKNRNKKLIGQVLFVIAAVIAVLFFGRECSKGARQGIYYCLDVLVPSIFPFMIISVFTARCGLSQRLGKHTEKFCIALFGVSGNLSAVIIMSMIGGYPVGARGIAKLRKSGAISESDAKRAAYFAVGAGPGFLITFLGNGLMNCPEIGVCMLIAQVLSVIILGVLSKKNLRKTSNYNSHKELCNPLLPFASAVTEAVADSTYGMLEMCGMVIIFSAITSITENLFGDYNVYAAIALEVTTACGLLARQSNIALMAFAAGFGGLCVHFQIFSALKGIRINKWLFFFFRIIQGILTYLFTTILIKISGISLPVFSSFSTAPELTLSSSVVGSGLLILCGIGFIYSISMKNQEDFYVRNSRNN